MQASKALLRCSWVKDLIENAAEVVAHPLDGPTAVISAILDLSADPEQAPAAYSDMCYANSPESATDLESWAASMWGTPEGRAAQKERDQAASQSSTQAQQEADKAAQQEADAEAAHRAAESIAAQCEHETDAAEAQSQPEAAASSECSHDHLSSASQGQQEFAALFEGQAQFWADIQMDLQQAQHAGWSHAQASSEPDASTCEQYEAFAEGHAVHNTCQYAQTDNSSTPDVFTYCETRNTAEWDIHSQSPSETFSTSDSGAETSGHTKADTAAQAHMEAEAFLRSLL